jgi:membrane protein
MVMVTIENALNKIWKVRSQRHGTSAFLLYWAILSLTPIMLGLSVAISSYLMSMPIITKELHVNLSRMLSYAPFIISVFCFSFLYLVVPNIKVKITHALTGAFVAAYLVELAKMGFTWYLSSYDTYELLYGAFATVPIFFLWVYWAWFIILMGAEVAYAFSAPHYRRTGMRLDGLTHTIHWLGYLYHAQSKGQGLTLEALIKKDERAYEVKPEIIIQHLVDAKLITSKEDGAFILCKNLDNLAFDDFRTLIPWRLPKIIQNQSTISDNEQYIKLLQKYQTALAATLHVPVSSLFDSNCQ